MKLKQHPAWRKVFLRHIRNGKSMEEACHLSRVGRSRINQERKLHVDFAKEMDEARELAPRALSW